MKKLNNFATFDASRFLKNKSLLAMKSENLIDFDTQSVLGAKYTLIIWSDNTDYGNESVSNVGETLTVKVIGATPRIIKNPTQVKIVNPVGVIFGEYRNQLSIKADDVVPIKEG